MRRGRRGAAVFLVAVGLGLAAPARAGDRLQIPQLVARSEAAVVVEVRPARGPAPDQLKALQVVAGPDSAAMASRPDWSRSSCIPSRAELKRWVAKHKSWPARKLWQQALSAPRFESLVFLQTIKGQLQPSCELESMLMKHTSLHPDFAAYVAEVKAAWASRQP
jgi:hypothetical protein